MLLETLRLHYSKTMTPKLSTDLPLNPEVEFKSSYFHLVFLMSIAQDDAAGIQSINQSLCHIQCLAGSRGLLMCKAQTFSYLQYTLND